MKTFHKILLFALLLVCLSAGCNRCDDHRNSHSDTSRSGPRKLVVLGLRSNRSNRHNNRSDTSRSRSDTSRHHRHDKVSKKSLSLSKSVSLKQNVKFSLCTTKKISFCANNSFSKKVSLSKSKFSKKWRKWKRWFYLLTRYPIIIIIIIMSIPHLQIKSNKPIRIISWILY
jgi:hypothetical protein